MLFNQQSASCNNEINRQEARI
ncbi:hypothetical protein V12B01_13755 [Vibrio splendidus 12B01]|nr:hypothetical protein V12B01_13755 [Vibrio splendidus 12B01]